MSREDEIRWQARALVELPGERPDGFLAAAAHLVRDALRPGPGWGTEELVVKGHAETLLFREARLLASLTAEEVTWGYGPAEEQWLAMAPEERTASRRRRAPETRGGGGAAKPFHRRPGIRRGGPAGERPPGGGGSTGAPAGSSPSDDGPGVFRPA